MLREAWYKLNLPQAISLCGAVAGAVCLVVFAPPAFWERLDRVDWKFWLGGGLATASAVASAFLGKLFHPAPVRGPNSVRPPPPIPTVAPPPPPDEPPA